MKRLVAASAVIAVLGWSFAASAEGASDRLYLRVDTGGSFSVNTGKDLQSDVGSSPIVGIGVGAKLIPFLRTDLTVSYRPGYSFVATDTTFVPGATLIAHGHVKTLGVLANAYYDFPSLAGVIPYIGGGVGFARNDLGMTTITTTTGTPLATINGAAATHLAWQAGAGISYPLGGNIAADFGYRYFHAGEAKSGDTGTVLGVPTRGLTNRGDILAHEIQAGVRVGF